jgi:hypothetical protein
MPTKKTTARDVTGDETGDGADAAGRTGSDGQNWMLAPRLNTRPRR